MIVFIQKCGPTGLILLLLTLVILGITLWSAIPLFTGPRERAAERAGELAGGWRQRRDPSPGQVPAGARDRV